MKYVMIVMKKKMKNKIIPLDEKINTQLERLYADEWLDKEDAKETLQNLQEELKEKLEKYGYPSALFLINNLFLKHIGKELLKWKIK